MSKYMVITNNPLVRSRLDDTHEVIYLELSYEELLKVVRDRIYEGHRLLTHPLSGSVKPKETPYKSVLISERKGAADDVERAFCPGSDERRARFFPGPSRPGRRERAAQGFLPSPNNDVYKEFHSICHGGRI